MRLKSISIEGFRAFTTRVDLDLAADVILLHGPNGAGKTSLLDAILWALTGRIERFSGKGGPVSLYAREGIARVELVLEDGKDEIAIIRTSDGDKDSLRLRTRSDTEVDGALAVERACGLLLPHLKDRQDAPSALANVLTRGVYLQQDLVRQFVDTDTPSERFALLSEVVGAGVVLELQQTLERSRNLWSRSTSALRKEALDPLQVRLDQVNDQLSRLASDVTAVLDAGAASNALFNKAAALLGQRRLSAAEPPNTPEGLDKLLREVAAERARVERELATASSLLDEVGILETPVSSDASRIEALTAEVEADEAELEKLEAEIEVALADASAQRQQDLSAANRASRAATMAAIALEQLGDLCPVCQQRHDFERTVAHLKDLVAEASAPIASAKDTEAPVAALNARRSTLRQQLEVRRRDLYDLSQQQRARQARQELVVARLRDLGVPEGSDPRAALEQRRLKAEGDIAAITALAREGEQLSLSVVRLSEQRKRAELLRERETLIARVKEQASQIEEQERTHALAGRIIEELRGASLAVTEKQVAQIAPLFQRIYSRIDPHPTFRVTQVLTSMERGKGQLRVGVADPKQGERSHEAGPLLSSSQLNSFAVSLFLALNLALPSLRLRMTMLDDPLQSLDAINLLGLVDVLRRFRSHRQIIVSTHEARLLGLLQRKLRPVREGERMITVAFGDWSRDGPSMRVLPTTYDAQEGKVLAA